MDRFYFSRTYEFQAPQGSEQFLLFNLKDRRSDSVTFSPLDNPKVDSLTVPVELDGNTEIAKFLYHGIPVTLRADDFHSKGYMMTAQGIREKKMDRVRDIHMNTSRNRDDIARSKLCFCLDCRAVSKNEEVVHFIDNGETATCPFCGMDALLGDASGVRFSAQALLDTHMNYFNYSINPTVEIIFQPMLNIGVPGSQPQKENPLTKEILLKALTNADCRFRDISDKEAREAIEVALTLYFKNDKEDLSKTLANYKVIQPIDFEITLPYLDGRTLYFTLNPDKTLKFPDD